MCLRSVLIPLVCYPWPRLTSCRGSLTTFTCGASVRSSVGVPARMMSTASLGGQSRLKSGATASSLIIRSRFTTRSKRIQAGDASYAHAHRTNPANTKTVTHFLKLDFNPMDAGSGKKILIIEDESDVADLLEMGLHKAGFKTATAT